MQKAGWVVVVGWALSGQAAHALHIERLSPQGAVQAARQVVVRLNADAVALGSAQGPAPVDIRCEGGPLAPTAAGGSGRWNNAREWVWQWSQPLPVGMRCTVTPKKTFKSAAGATLEGLPSYQFEVSGPSVETIWPQSWQPIDESQFFALQLNGEAVQASVLEHVYCQAEGVGERIAVRWVEGAQRQALLESVVGESTLAQRSPAHFAVLACNRRLTAGSRMELVYGAGVAGPQGVRSAEAQRFAYTVRDAFSAEMQCERENAQAGCLPIAPVRLEFNAPVPRALAAQVRLVAGSKALEPELPEAAGDVASLQFEKGLQPLTRYQLQLPGGFQDDAGRPLRNASAFPLAVATGDIPPLAKFAAAPFGVVERFAEGPGAPALLPVTVRKVEPQLQVSAALVSTLQPQSDADIIAWLDKVQRYHDGSVARKQAAKDVLHPLPAAIDPDDGDYVATRQLSLLQGQAGVQQVPLPQRPAAEQRPLEVVGIPLAAGFHVVEIASQRLGEALLDGRYGASRTMYVRTAALVTNLAVHFKLGHEGSLAWVTTLDKGQPVAQAQVQVSDCRGRAVASAATDAQGVARFAALPSEAPHCDDRRGSGAYFVSARTAQAGGDLAFTWSDWQKGIEPWRFNLPIAWSAAPQLVAHTVMDRTLVRAGETVSMKHLIRTQTLQGLGVPQQLPTNVVITHTGSGQEFVQPLQWQRNAAGAPSAEGTWQVPRAAKLGQYEVALRMADGSAQSSGSLRVEAFRLPLLVGQVAPAAVNGPLVRPGALPIAVRLDYANGGAAAGVPVQVSALVRAHHPSRSGWDDYSFSPPQTAAARQGSDAPREDSRVVLDRAPVTLDAQGQGQVQLPALPPATQPQSLVLEASYADPNGEIQTLRSTHTLWPAAVVAGVRAEGWAASGQQLRFQALALGLNGEPQAGVALRVEAVLHRTVSARKRMVGGFYTYDNTASSQALGEVCRGTSDSRGLLLCSAELKHSGEVELIATATDAQGHAAQAATSVWVAQHGELWFGGQDHDRMDVLPEKRSYEPGETARLQVRMPFRHATALVTVEREGVLEARVVQLRGDNPTVELPIDGRWGPNVYVSVLALRGRLVQVPWYSFFTWGYQSPRAWWQAFWHEGKQYTAPTALVDLSKPAYRLGVAELQVGQKSQTLQVRVTPEKDSYRVRETARVHITVQRPDGTPAADAQVAVAAVDQALFELMPNASWRLREAMWQRRSWGVQTSTAQMEIIGRRHYGLKAAAAGGGGGTAPTRELLDTLLLWQPRVQLDAKGQATVQVPLNDALTAFRIAAIADDGVQWFGTGEASIRTTQELQIVSGLPPVVREGDQFRAQLTLRNTTTAPMQVQLTPRATWLELAPQEIALAAGAAHEATWDVTVPAVLGSQRTQQLLWEVQAKDVRTGVSDTLKLSQRVEATVPLAVQQSVLQRLEGPWSPALAMPDNALPGRGGVQLALSAQLAGGPDGLPGLKAWWQAYPYMCLEQNVGRAIGLRDAPLWRSAMESLPTYLDGDGLAQYFPAREGTRAQGSDALTAHLLRVGYEVAQLDPAFTIPPALRQQMEAGLLAFVQGKLQRNPWSPRADLPERKMAALAALAVHGRAQGRLLGSLQITPLQWPTHTLLDWITVLQHTLDAPQRAERLAQAQVQLRSRLSYHGSQLVLSTEAQDRWWWLMQGGDSNAARVLLAALQDASWRDEVPRLVTGLLARQQGGAWRTTVDNVWGDIALRQFSRVMESTPVTGTTTAVWGAQTANVDWKAAAASALRAQPAAAAAGHAGTPLPDHAALDAMVGRLVAGIQQDPAHPQRVYLPWGERRAAQLRITHHGSGAPWATLQSLAAVPRTAPFNAGYAVRKTITRVQPAGNAAAGRYQRGEVLRVRLEVQAAADMTWVVINDPIPAGATILGSGLGRDSAIATDTESSPQGAWPAYEERAQDGFRAYYAHLPQGATAIDYTLRLNNVGTLGLPPTRVEALYAPDVWGESPNPAMTVEPAGSAQP